MLWQQHLIVLASPKIILESCLSFHLPLPLSTELLVPCRHHKRLLEPKPHPHILLRLKHSKAWMVQISAKDKSHAAPDPKAGSMHGFLCADFSALFQHPQHLLSLLILMTCP